MWSFFRKMWSAISDNGENNSETIAVTDMSNYQPVSLRLPLPEDLVILVLSYLPANDLLTACTYVKEWKLLIEGHHLWSLKCEREGKNIPRIKPNPLPKHFYQFLYFAPFGKNMLLNPCGKLGLKHWRMIEGDIERYHEAEEMRGWEVEDPPQGADPVLNTNCQSCFTTTNYWCRKGQIIDLWEAGFSPELLDNLMPNIHISEWYCSRFDCGTEYELDIELLKDNKKDIVDNFHFYHKETQWTGRVWMKVEHDFKEYPTGVRYLHFVHAGKDTQYWAGNYGSKMAEGEVILKLRE